MESFWAKVQFTDTCWVWTASRDRDGYGLFRSRKLTPASWRAHRLAYSLEHGSVPPGPLDHLCRNRACVRPSHLEPVTHKVNCERGEKAQQTHCLRGHEYNEANTYRKPNGTRACRVCHKESERNYPERRAEAARRQRARKKAARGDAPSGAILRSGERNVNSKLTEEDVRTLIRDLEDGVYASQREAAARYGVTPPVVSSILNGRTWRHVTGYPKPTGRRKPREGVQ